MSQSASSPEEAIDPNQTVYTTVSKNRTQRSGTEKVFHTNRDCFNLQKSPGGVQEHNRLALANGWRECRACSDDSQATGEAESRPCPNCGRPCLNLPNHLRRCDG